MYVQALFSPEDFQTVMELVKSMKNVKEGDGSEEGEGEGEGEESKREDKQGDENTDGEEKVGGASGVIRVHATVGSASLLLHSSQHRKLASIALQGTYVGSSDNA